MDRLGRKTALNACALLLFAAAPRAGFAQDPPKDSPPKTAPEPVRNPGPRLLEGLEMQSELVYDADPKSPHVLRAAFAGKEHARYWIGLGAEGSQVRLMRLRSEGHVFALRVDAPGSIELEGAQRDETLAQLELRRALLQFESFEWKGEEATRTAALGTLGSLRARFASAKDARPVELAFLDPQGKLQDSCRAIRWDASGARPLPSALELWHEGTRIWSESVKRVLPMTYTRDAFVPRDRAEGTGAQGTWNVIQTPSPEFAARRFELPKDADWDSARKELERLRAEWAPRLAKSGLELESRGTLELDPELHPRFLVLRLAKLPAELPEGFERVAGRAAVGVPLEGFEAVAPGALRALREKVPAESKAGAPYVRWSLDPSQPKQVLLLLAWTTSR